ncbi:3-deoxy-D-manno-octulosonic-acid transferase [Lewinella marina]|uniref:3-deoxy-D-manno-octulosonic acid transferase n=1 Tax=Neolewinella marina TaxID=438751 RepID=A0A2G0CCA3_9BACT|nr:glycosyltransferase N-terminal domain-containing protein [Neolewinella marina]NJB87719.1 3-deoxy-D-manno-octulosonic-acid transferase [Neolewinella marina]PHK97604.1 hypothetical protein CGL56_14295 [Neolewinella marina]
MEWLYRSGLGAYHLGIRTAALLGNPRARQWISGRERDVSAQIEALHAAGRPILWLHAASLGEFEQGLPVLTALREQRPGWAVVVTFFSPSGYERRHDTEHADVVAYLPRDTPAAARNWQRILRPRLAIFVKYEFWHFHLKALAEAGVPTFLVAGSFRPGQHFFQPYGGWWRRMLHSFTHLFVQTEADRQLLTGVGIDQVTVTGDPRMDRTAELANAPFSDERLADFCEARPVLLAGSVWAADVELLRAAWPRLRQHWRLILAPHQLRESEMAGWQAAFDADRYTGPATGRDVLILDMVGILSRAYRYGSMAYVGGAFGSGLHNTLEPLSYGLPVLFGPKHQKFPEAGQAIARGGAFSVTRPDELVEVMDRLTDAEAYAESRSAQLAYRDENRGAGQRTARLILQFLLWLLLSWPAGAQTWPAADRMLSALDGSFTKSNLLVALSGAEWRSGLCLAVAELERGGTVSLDLPLEGGTKYLIVGAAESSAADIDVLLRDGNGEVVEQDTETDKTPVVEIWVDSTAIYTVQVQLLSGQDSTAFVSLGLLQSGGTPLADRDYRAVSRQFAAAAGAVRAAGGAGRLGSGLNRWCVLGYLIGEGGGATLDNLQLPAGRHFLAAAAGERVQNLDLYLATEDQRILRADNDPDPYPMIEYENSEPAALRLRIALVKSRGDALVLLGFFSQ